MTNNTFQVIWYAIGESFDDDGVYTANDFWSDPEHYLQLYLEFLDNNSCFVDGYPSGEEFRVKNVETGEIHSFTVHTDWSPSFYCLKGGM